jgi:cell division protein YceG involved in septum cleavage
MTGIRGIATGILLATIVLGITFLLGGYSNNTKEKELIEIEQNITEADVQAYLEEQNLVTLTKDEYDQLSQPQETENEKDKASEETKDSEDTEEAKENQEDIVVQANLTIKSGMSTGEVADYLKEVKIIKDANKLIDYLEDNDLVTSVKAGTYKVNSDMSISEIAKTITSY